MKGNQLVSACIVSICMGISSSHLAAAGEPYPQPWSVLPGHTQPPSLPNGWRYPADSTENAPPSVTVRVSEAIPYVRQSVVLTLRVISGGNVLSLAPETPVLETALIESLDGPRQTPVDSTGWITEYHYALTPLAPGDVEIPPVTVHGTFTNGSPRSAFAGRQTPTAREFEVSSVGTQYLTARSAEPEIRPWLALRELRLRVRVLSDGPYEVGHPVVVELEAIGAGTTGEALPSLRGYLDNPLFKVYPEGVATLSRLAADGKSLSGRRTEKFTLLPQESGELRLRALPIDWWNVATGKEDRSVLGGYTLPVQGAVPASGEGGSSGFTLLPHYRNEHLIAGYWLPAAVVGLLAAFWLGVWVRGRRMPVRLGSWLSALATQVTDGINGVLQRLGRYSPVPPYRRLRHRLMLAMPAVFKLRYCLRRIDCEHEPTEWCQLFQILVYKYLDMPVNAPLSDIVEAMIKRNPGLNAGQLRALVQELDGTRYGGQSLDFVAWKKTFRRRLCPWSAACRAPNRPPPASPMPGLNPDTSSS
jgi:hypothetical protein